MSEQIQINTPLGSISLKVVSESSFSISLHSATVLSLSPSETATSTAWPSRGGRSSNKPLLHRLMSADDKSSPRIRSNQLSGWLNPKGETERVTQRETEREKEKNLPFSSAVLSGCHRSTGHDSSSWLPALVSHPSLLFPSFSPGDEKALSSLWAFYPQTNIISKATVHQYPTPVKQLKTYNLLLLMNWFCGLLILQKHTAPTMSWGLMRSQRFWVNKKGPTVIKRETTIVIPLSQSPKDLKSSCSLTKGYTVKSLSTAQTIIRLVWLVLTLHINKCSHMQEMMTQNLCDSNAGLEAAVVWVLSCITKLTCLQTDARCCTCYWENTWREELTNSCPQNESK